MTLVGVNHRQPILHMPKKTVHCYTTDEIINQFAIVYMIITLHLGLTMHSDHKLKNSEVSHFLLGQWKLLKIV